MKDVMSWSNKVEDQAIVSRDKREYEADLIIQLIWFEQVSVTTFLSSWEMRESQLDMMVEMLANCVAC